MDRTRIEEAEAQLSRAAYHIQRAQENIERQKESVQELANASKTDRVRRLGDR
jgi:hypothetical protein